MTACAIVRRRFMRRYLETVRPIGALLARSSSHQRQARIGLFPSGTNPDVLRIFPDRQSAGGSGKKVEVVDVVARSGDHRMKSASHQHHVTVPGFQHLVGPMLSGVEMLKGKGV